MAARLLVVVPAYSFWEYTVAAVRSAYACSELSLQCAVFDDASPDFTQEDEQRVRAIDASVHFHRFELNAGMTRSWNAGLALARDIGAEYCCITNNDVVFSPGWDSPLARWCDEGFALTGPVTNAPGHTIGRQGVSRWLAAYEASDDERTIAEVARRLRLDHPDTIVEGRLNGFCLFGRTDVFWKHAFDPDRDLVLDPAFAMERNEEVLQDRWARDGLTFGAVPASYVLHYRSVARGDRYRRGQSLRRGGAAVMQATWRTRAVDQWRVWTQR